MISTMLIQDLPTIYSTQRTQRYMESLVDGNKCNEHRQNHKTEFRPPVSLQSLGFVLEEPVYPTPCVKPTPPVVKQPAAQSPTDVDLTCLSWLQNLKLMNGASLPTPPISPEPSMSNTFTGPPTPPTEPEEPPVDYRMVDVKPPYSYAQLICMAMTANDNIMTLSAIYSWIRDNFLYYQRVDPAWHNSIRHNLSLNKSFIKVPRGKDEPGKGGFWRLDTSSSAGTCASTRKRKTTASRRFRPRRIKTAPATPAPIAPPLVCPPENHVSIFSEDDLSNTWLSTDNWSGTQTDLEFLDAILNNFGTSCTEPCLNDLE